MRVLVERFVNSTRLSSETLSLGRASILQETDPADGLGLDPPCFPVSRIIAPVPLGAHFRKIFRRLGIGFVDQILQFGGKFVVSLF